MQVGPNNASLPSTPGVLVSCEAVIVGSTSDLVVLLASFNKDGTSTAWTAGSAQTETATAVGTITPSTGSGNATVVVTAPGMTNTPKTVSVPVLAGDTAATWAGKVRTALAADPDVSSFWTVGGSSTSILLTRKPFKTYTVNGAAINLHGATIAANISLDNGTCTGITTAATSTEGAATATAGVWVPELNGTDIFGDSVSVGGVRSLEIRNDILSGCALKITQSTRLVGYEIPQGDSFQHGAGSSTGFSSLANLLLETGSGPSSHLKLILTYSGT